MARIPHDSDRDFPADPHREDAAKNLVAHSEVLEPFDEAARARFGRIISLMVTKRKRRWTQ
jgi:hypothetical protein